LASGIDGSLEMGCGGGFFGTVECHWRRPYSRFAAGSLGMDFLAMMDLMDFNDNR
jgi:hypothetical protein